MIDRKDYGDFDETDEGLAMQLKTIAATDALIAYLKAMESVYNASLPLMDGEVTEAQSIYHRIVERHVGIMEGPLRSPWLRADRGNSQD